MGNKDYFESLPLEKLQKFIADHYMNVIPSDMKEFKKCVFNHGFTYWFKDKVNFIYIGFTDTTCKPMSDVWLKRGITMKQLDWDFKLMMAEHYKDDPEYAKLLEKEILAEQDKTMAEKDKAIGVQQQAIQEKQQSIAALKKEKAEIAKTTTEAIKKIKSISEITM